MGTPAAPGPFTWPDPEDTCAVVKLVLAHTALDLYKLLHSAHSRETYALRKLVSTGSPSLVRELQHQNSNLSTGNIALTDHFQAKTEKVDELKLALRTLQIGSKNAIVELRRAAEEKHLGLEAHVKALTDRNEILAARIRQLENEIIDRLIEEDEPVAGKPGYSHSDEDVEKLRVQFLEAERGLKEMSAQLFEKAQVLKEMSIKLDEACVKQAKLATANMELQKQIEAGQMDIQHLKLLNIEVKKISDESLRRAYEHKNTISELKNDIDGYLTKISEQANSITELKRQTADFRLELKKQIIEIQEEISQYKMLYSGINAEPKSAYQIQELLDVSAKYATVKKHVFYLETTLQEWKDRLQATGVEITTLKNASAENIKESKRATQQTQVEFKRIPELEKPLTDTDDENHSSQAGDWNTIPAPMRRPIPSTSISLSEHQITKFTNPRGRKILFMIKIYRNMRDFTRHEMYMDCKDLLTMSSLATAIRDEIGMPRNFLMGDAHFVPLSIVVESDQTLRDLVQVLIDRKEYEKHLNLPIICRFGRDAELPLLDM